MPEPTNDNLKPLKPKQDEKEMSMEQRLLLAFVLMGIVLVGTQYFYKPEQPKPVKPIEQASPQQATKPAAPQQAPVTPETSVAQVTAQKEEIYAIDTNLYRVEFTNRGGVVRGWTLKKFLDNSGKPLQLVNQSAAAKGLLPFSIEFKDQKPATDVNQALFVAKPAADGHGIDYEFSDGKALVRKSFRFGQDSYVAQVSSEVSQNGAGLPHLLVWRGGFGDRAVHNAYAAQHSLYYDPSNNKLNVSEAKAAKNGPVGVTGSHSFGGLEDAFFAAVFLPHTPGTAFEVRTYSDPVQVLNGTEEQPHVGAGIGGSSSNQFSLFVGPKDIDLLRKVDPKLEMAVNFGWFGFIAKPLFLTVNYVNDKLVHNYGWSIVLVTLGINLLLFPFKLSSLKSTKKMQALQPKIQAINDKYKNVGLRDPKKAEQNEEVMALYKVHGVNPVGGCLPLLVQMPFLYAFYTVLSVSIEMRGAHWLWVNDLSQPEALPVHILPLLLIGTQFGLQRMTPQTAGVDPAQQKMMMFMPLVFGFMFYNLSSGLVLYWLTGNLVGIAQQWIINRLTPPPVIEAKPVKSPKKKDR